MFWVLKRQRCGQDLGSGEGRGQGGGRVAASLTEGWPVLPYRLVLTLTLPCGPPACPPASPPFLVGNRKFGCALLHAGWGKHTNPAPMPGPGGAPLEKVSAPLGYSQTRL